MEFGERPWEHPANVERKLQESSDSPCTLAEIGAPYIRPSLLTRLLGVPRLDEDHFVVHQDALSAAFTVAHEMSREGFGIVLFGVEAKCTTSLSES